MYRSGLDGQINSWHTGISIHYGYRQYGCFFSLDSEYLFGNNNSITTRAIMRFNFNFRMNVFTQRDSLSFLLSANYSLAGAARTIGNVFGDLNFYQRTVHFDFANIVNLQYSLPPLPIDLNLIPTTWPVWLHAYWRSLHIICFYHAGYAKDISSLNFIEFLPINIGYFSQSFGIHTYLTIHMIGQNTNPLEIGLSVYGIIDAFEVINEPRYSLYFRINV